MTRANFALLSFLLLFCTANSFAQSKLIVFSDNNELFTASFSEDFTNEKVSNFFIRSNIQSKEEIINISINSNSFSKKVSFEKDRQSIYELVKEKDEYKLRFRGYYEINESLSAFNFKFVKEGSNSQNSLIHLNDILEDINSGSISINQITQRLNSGNYNCRQLKELYSRINSDAEKLRIFELSNHNCFDPQNVDLLLSEIESTSVKNKIKEIALKNLNQF